MVLKSLSPVFPSLNTLTFPIETPDTAMALQSEEADK